MKEQARNWKEVNMKKKNSNFMKMFPMILISVILTCYFVATTTHLSSWKHRIYIIVMIKFY